MSTQSTGNSEETRLIFESVVPAVTGEENDNDTLFITDDGTETGNILEMWKFDIETQSWYKIPNPICETLDYTIIDDTRPISRWADAGLRIKWESNITLTPSNVVGDIVTTDQAFFEMPNGDKIPLKVTVERRTTGPWNIFIGANWGMSNTPWSADYQITVEILPDCFGNTFDGALMSIIPTSVWGGEALLFSQPYPIEEYIRWPWAPALTLPYVWFWNNNNNNNTSALWFWVSDVISFRANWQNRISSNISVWLRTIPWYKEYDVCEILDFSKKYTDRAIENIQDQDTFGTVTQPTENLTTTNEIDITPDDFYIAFPDGTTWASPKCPEEMTRAQLRALRTAWGLSTDCHYVITNPNAQGTLTAQEIILHAVNANTLSMQAGILTSHDVLAWNGTYDIDADDVLEVTDNLGNQVISNASIINFPFGIAAVNGNTVNNKSNVLYTSGNFIDNVVESDATVSVTWNVQRNHFESQSNTTVSAWDFIENRVGWDATVVTSTTGDVDGNTFGSLSLSNISGTGNFDNNEVGTDATITITSWTTVNSKFEQLSNYTQTWGILRESTLGQDADLTISVADNYENVFGASTIFRQVGTGYVRYSTIEGTTTWTNGNTNVSNVTAYTSTVNTTGSTGTISNSTLNRMYGINLQNIPSLTITDSTISNYATIQTNASARIYIYRSTITDGARFLCGAGSRIDMSYTNINTFWYVQTTVSGSELYVNYSNIGGYSYIRNLTPNTHRVERTRVQNSSNIRFEGTALNCRAYYSTVDSWGTLYFNGTSNACYAYYCTIDSFGQMYFTNSVNARFYYNSVSSFSYIRSTGATATHYAYYCNATARGYIQFLNSTGRFYACNANSQSILEKRGIGGNIYYSNFSAYFYAYITRTGGTNTGLFGMGRRSAVVTTPVLVAPYATGSAWSNF